MTKIIKYYFPALILMGIIFYLSSIPDLNMGTSNVTFEVLIRKFGHFLEYSVLFWFFWRICYLSLNLFDRDAVIISLILTLLFAISDEFHQTFVLGRSGRFIDVVFDFLSALFAAQIIAIFVSGKIKKQAIFMIAAISIGISALTIEMIDEGNKIAQNTVIFPGPSTSSTEKNADSNSKNINIGATQPTNQSGQNDNAPIPQRVLIKVPFTPQAPFAQWDQFHEESCEETALIMVKYFLDGKTLDANTAENEIQKMIKFEITKYGDYVDSNAQQIVTMAHDFYGINNMKVIYDFKKEDLKKYLARGKPIIIPAAGQLLGNPNFKYPGPPYHAVVLIGYDGDIIITNDSGTRKGAGYRYNINTLYNAIHDFPGNRDKITEGRKAMIIVE